MLRQIVKTTKLNKSDLRHIRQLVKVCTNHDHFIVKLYWSILEERRTEEFGDFLYHIDGNLAAYAAAFVFSTDTAEISAMVHPKYRRRGLFKKLLKEAALELSHRAITTALIISYRGSTAVEYIKAIGGEYAYSEYEMTHKRPPEPKVLPEITLIPTTKQDIPTMAKIGAASFNSSFMEVLQRFIENSEEKNRKAWLLKVGDKENIGKIHVRFEDNQTAFIHDFCVLPEERGKGYAKAMTLKTMELLRKQGYRNIMLDVEFKNEAAIKLYQKCGFDITTEHDFWRTPIANLLKL